MPKVPIPNKPGVSNWVEKYNALPKGSWIRRAAEHLIGKGKSTGHAIAIAKEAAERLCRTGDLNFPGVQNANAGSRAQACSAIATWNQARARANAARGTDLAAAEAFAFIDLCRVETWGEYIHVLEPEPQRVIDLTARRIAA